jgi:formylglycine-generating enzyme required for sulfatase activity
MSKSVLRALYIPTCLREPRLAATGKERMGVLEKPGPTLKPGIIDGMVLVPSGIFRMGSDKHYLEEAPSHRVAVDGFWIDRTRVTSYFPAQKWCFRDCGR